MRPRTGRIPAPRVLLIPVLGGWIGLAGSAPIARAEPVRALWVSPDWLFSGDGDRSGAGARDVVRRVVAAARKSGVNTLFLETLVRGQSIAPAATAGLPDLPVYPLVHWPFDPRAGEAAGAGTVEDLLQIFIDEARPQGIEIHAWIHLFYWRSDNESFRRPWQDGPSLFDGLLAGYLDEVAASVRSIPKRRVAADLAALLRTGFRWDAFQELCDELGISSFEGRMRNLLVSFTSSGAPPPRFLLLTPSGRVHDGLASDLIMGLYVDPSHPGVQEVIGDAIGRIVATHPGLAGVHLDHVRYPNGPRGEPEAFREFPSPMATGRYTPRFEELGETFTKFLGTREDTLRRFVGSLRARIGEGRALTASVHPLYYRHRDQDTGLVPAGLYVGQDWARWDVDTVFPLLYGKSSAQVAALREEERSRARARAGAGTIPRVVAGVTGWSLVTSGGAGSSWALFDMDGLVSVVGSIPGSSIARMGLGDGLH